MNRRVLILLLLLVVILVGGAAVLFLQPQPPQTDTPDGGNQTGQQSTPVTTPIPQTRIIVAGQELSRGGRIPREAINIVLWPVSAVTDEFITEQEYTDNPAIVVGKVARTDIVRDQPIFERLLVDDLLRISRTGSDVAAIMDTGLRAISIPVDRLTSVAYGIQDGDYVDVIVSFLFVDIDPAFQTLKPNKLSILTIREGVPQFSEPVQGELGTSNFYQGTILIVPTEPQRPRLVTQTTIQQAFVVHVGNFPLDGKSFLARATPLPTPTPPEGEATSAAPPPTPTPTAPDVVTLAVTPQDAVVLTWIVEHRLPITLVIRSVKDIAAGPATTDAVTLQYMVDRYTVTLPPALPYALEPALRSIRRLVVGTEVFLSGTVVAR
jgi:pilus assembly protein CpaB